MFVIYKITNLINGKNYIGQTNNLKRRIGVHKNDSIKSNKPLYKAIRNYGWENFDVSVLLENIEDQNEVNHWETIFINVYKSKIDKNGYNLANGGFGCSGFKMTNEAKIKISESKKGKKQSKEHIAKLSKVRKGKKISEETRIKYSNALKGLIKKKQKNSTSKYKGVCFNKAANKWVARFYLNKNKWLGYFLTEEDAHNAILREVYDAILQQEF